MKKSIIALTALVAATVGFQTQAQAGHKYNKASGFQFEVQLGDGIGFRIGDNISKVHQPYKRAHRRYKAYKKPSGYKKPYIYQNDYVYKRRYRCDVAGKYAIKRSLRNRGFYDIRWVKQRGRFYSVKAISSRGHLVRLRINGCNYRIVNRRIIQAYPALWSQGNPWKTYW